MSVEQFDQLLAQPDVCRVVVLLLMPDQADLHRRHIERQRRDFQRMHRGEGFGQAGRHGAE